jgi:diamine N-acetyltransferase
MVPAALASDLTSASASASGKVFLRALQHGDLDYLYRWENAPEVWQYGDCGAGSTSCDGDGDVGGACAERFSREQLGQLIVDQTHGIEVAGQLRLVVCRPEDAVPIGFVDLFDFDPGALSAGVGILVCDPADRGRGYGGEALRLMLDYARRVLGMRYLRCDIAADNAASLALFSRAGFVRADNLRASGKNLIPMEMRLCI